ncbi:MAG: hypothetical protein JW958_02510 [Candidatus Eisenbacteria bacterium]|nr:hypothetical protein [Candidatus Eisenbacteria bacterium]
MSEQRDDRIEVRIPRGKITIRSAHCPSGCDLMAPDAPVHGHPSIAVRILHGGREGTLHLDPTYGSYDNICDLEIPDGAEVEFACPHCGVSLVDRDEHCPSCSAHMFVLHLPREAIVEGCLRKGCAAHTLRLVDLDEQILRMYGDETGPAFDL